MVSWNFLQWWLVLGGIKNFHGFARGFVISELVFGSDNPTHNPSAVLELSLLTKIQALQHCSHKFQRSSIRGLYKAWSCL